MTNLMTLSQTAKTTISSSPSKASLRARIAATPAIRTGKSSLLVVLTRRLGISPVPNLMSSLRSGHSPKKP